MSLSISFLNPILELEREMEDAMPVNFLYTFPLTHEHAVNVLETAAFSPKEKQFMEEGSLQTLYHPLGSPIREHWRLEEKSYPLPRHYMKRFALGDAGNMSSLIILDYLARLRGEPFNLAGYVQAFRQQWFEKGIDPLTLEKIPKTT